MNKTFFLSEKEGETRSCSEAKLKLGADYEDFCATGTNVLYSDYVCRAWNRVFKIPKVSSFPWENRSQEIS